MDQTDQTDHVDHEDHVMHINFDSLFFLGFGVLVMYLGLSRSRFLFWGATRHEGLEKRLGAGYKRIVNITIGGICLVFGLYFLLIHT